MVGRWAAQGVLCGRRVQCRERAVRGAPGPLGCLWHGASLSGQGVTKEPRAATSLCEGRWTPGSFCGYGNKAWQRSDAVIVTGGDETIAWAEVQSRTHSISSERCLLRSHSISVAVLDGNETPEERAGLAEDVLLHEGLGCRSVAAIWAPAAVVQVPYVQAFTRFRELFPTHPSTGSTVRMDRAFLQALGLPYAGGPSKGFLLSVGAPEVQRPGHVRWVHYKCWAEVLEGLKSLGTRIQCVFAREGLIAHLPTEPPPALLGQAQRPPLSWQPDSLDTVAFLRGL